MKAEQTYLGLLANMTTFKVDGDQLTLADESGHRLVYTTAQASPSP
jgi:heat shock protein HslJ